ncbi:hypothetical protein LIER_20023 [Lithospermum erythrorhizon]|uniref:Protein kinase domain-containing protein n=1 Tax=Lithospermum erythrorhizon TaxID=34254 RepID=A0AAV3QK11_LITER
MLLFWRFNEHGFVLLLLLLCLVYQDLSFCFCLNDEGVDLLRFKERVKHDPFVALSSWKDVAAQVNPCSWFGVGCSNGNALLLINKSFFYVSSSGEQTERTVPRKLLVDLPGKKQQEGLLSPLPPNAPSVRKDPSPHRRFPSPSPSPAPSPSLHQPPDSSFLQSPESSFEPANNTSSSNNLALILLAAIGGPLLLVIIVILICVVRGKKVAVVNPWVTGLSGQLQKAFVTGVPNLKRSEIDAACEGFSNVIGTLSVGTLYKGTLSSGVEIAVVSFAVESVKDWSKNCETQFRKKIDTLSKLNHKNFVNLLGFCEEESPFTRMIVFEYAPNGTLFEHLHIREAEHLNWEMRMRIVMGIVYCLEYMHQLTPQLPHRNLTSSSVYLTEDYAAKLSDFSFSAEEDADVQSNIYSFGVILFEMITGKLPFSVDNGSPEDWASDYLQGIRDLRETVDPTLVSFHEEQLTQLNELIKSCVNPVSELRPSIREVSAGLREITGIGPDGAIPKLSPLWWAELEILSTEVN